MNKMAERTREKTTLRTPAKTPVNVGNLSGGQDQQKTGSKK
jgi:hypothetical protein